MRKLLLRFVAVLVVAAGVPVVLAGPASAHHPEITASVDCAGKVSFTARAWEGDGTDASRTNTKVVVSNSVNGSVVTGEFKRKDFSFPGTFDIGSAKSAVITVKAVNNWGNGAGGGQVAQTTVTVSADCDVPPVDKVGVCHRTASPDDKNPYVYISVPRDEANGHITGTDSQHNHKVTWREDGIWRGVPHKAGDERLDYFAPGGAADCNDTTPPTPEPAATIGHDCDGYTVTLDNTKSYVPVTFRVTVNGKSVDRTIAAKASDTVTGTLVEDELTTITVTSGKDTLTSDTFTVDCKKPAATLSQDCTSFTVLLDNHGNNVAATYNVTIDGVTTPHVVAKNDTKSIVTQAAEDSTHDVKVTSGGTVLVDTTVKIDCAKPAATVWHGCTTYKIKLDNRASKVEVTFIVTVNGDSKPVVVGAGKYAYEEGSVVEDQQNTITVQVGNETLKHDTFYVDCQKPKATFSQDCTGFTVFLDNRGNNVDATFDVTIDGVTTPHVVAENDTETIVTPAAEDSAHTVKVVSGNDKLVYEEFTIDCEQPAAKVWNSCTHFYAKLINTSSDVPVTFTVTVNGVGTDYLVPDGETKVVSGPVAEDSSNTVTVSHGSTDLATKSFDVDCQQPAATIVDNCTGYVVTLDNSASKVEVTFTVTINGVPTDYTVPAGTTQKIEKTDATEGSTYDITVTSGDTQLDTKAFTIDCEKPVVTVIHDCTSYTVTLDNSASEIPVTFTVIIDGVESQVTVENGATKVITDTVVEDSSHTIEVANGDEVLAQAAFTVDCVKPAAMVAQSCLGYDVTLDNSASTLPVEFTVTVNGAEQQVTVPNGQVQHVTGTVVEDSTNTITVRGGGADLVSTTFTQDCQTYAPAAAVVHDCTTYTATLNNAGSNLPVDFTVNVNGANQVVTVPAGQTQQISGPVVEDGAYTVTVSAAGTQLVSGSFVVDCVTGAGDSGTGDNGDNGNGDNGNGGGGGGGGAGAGGGGHNGGGAGSDSPASDTGTLPATGSPALLGLVLLLGLGLLAGGGLLVAGDRRRARLI
ncbi:hypothetical protein [Nocardioides sp. LHG3406-4]|uniref:hypothetical protein n=1 Tax=Nocardioides sp. LHG3406-4 TaxID=2804575 RepID=UPI003CE9879B